MPFEYFLLLVVSLAIFRPLTVLIHELGHGIPALILTDDKVTLYIGSYGDTTSSVRLQLGRLEFYFTKKVWLWKSGLCVMHSKVVPVNHQIIVTVLGPMMSLVLALVFGYMCFYGGYQGYKATIFFFFAASSLMDLYNNIIPNASPILLANGETTFNDGHSLKGLFKFKRLNKKYNTYAELFNAQQFHLCAPLLKQIIKEGFTDSVVYRVAIASYLNIKDYITAAELQKEFESKYDHSIFTTNDYCNVALIKCRFNDYDAGIKAYNRALELDPNHLIALNNRGYTHNIMEAYEDAILDFDKALIIDPNYAYTLNNRGLSKIKLGNHEAGLADIKRSMELDKNNAYAYRNLGIYHLDLKEANKALQYFEKALALDDDTHMIHELIAQASSAAR